MSFTDLVDTSGLFGWVSDLFMKFFDWVVGLLPDWLGGGYSDLIHSFGSVARYLAYLGGFDVLGPAILSAYVVRFLIRRIPGVG